MTVPTIQRMSRVSRFAICVGPQSTEAKVADLVVLEIPGSSTSGPFPSARELQRPFPPAL